ncbi:MAG: zeta toxin family protein [Kiritimatiellae bacterium]|nr:zeta toxin family protein [Kiritimatiellia bacterium]
MKQCIIIAGPNGAGKTTFANSFLPFEAKTLAFMNADLIAQGLSPFAPEKVAVEASKILILRIKELCRVNESFALESTLSGKAHLRLISKLRKQGYFVSLHFLKLASVELAIERVKTRVMDGGHNIPEDVIRRRYKRGLINLPEYKCAVNKWKIWDTSSGKPELIDEN